jgi:hypothetical protein
MLRVNAGEIHGRAMEHSVDTVLVEYPIEHRIRMTASISCEKDILRVVEIRGAGRMVEIVVGIEAY